MSADEFLSLLTQGVFLVVLVAVVLDAIHRPRRAEIDIALFFGTIVAVLFVSDLETWFGVAGEVVTSVNLILIVAIPYLLLRLVDDFSVQPSWLMRLAAAIFVAIALATAIVPVSTSVPFVALPIGWIVLMGAYTSVEFLLGARRASGVTSRRMLAVAAGSGAIAAVFLASGVSLFVPLVAGPAGVIGRILAVLCGIAYFVGFAPPQFLRRAWQEPELRAFLERATTLARLPDMLTTVRQLEYGAAQATGAAGASLGLWDAERDCLVYLNPDGTTYEAPTSETIGGRAFTRQRAIFSAVAATDDPANASTYRDHGVETILAAPVTSGEKRLGILATYAQRAPIFANDDLQLVQLLADQAAVILENRSLISDVARVQAREEATRLKDDFLSAAAHDLRTPLTTLLLHAEMLRRHADQDPERPADRRRIDAIVREGNRLKSLVTDFLDAARAERGQLLGHVLTQDLVAIVQEAAEIHASPRHTVRVEADHAVMAAVDGDRIRQLLDNLVENAIKYSPDGGDVVIAVHEAGANALLTVSDTGIGIPDEDQSDLFQRFHRGSNVDDRRFQGLGLGLYICRSIAEEHGGRIWVTSSLGHGTTFHVNLPLATGSGVSASAAKVVASPVVAPLSEGAPGMADA